MRGALQHADRAAGKFRQIFGGNVLVHQEALTVVEVHHHHTQADGDVAKEGEGRVARQNIDLARLQRGEAAGAGGRDVADFCASPNTAAATARQASTSRPLQTPLLSGKEKPPRPVLTPQATKPFCRTLSRVAASATARLIASAAASAISFSMMCVSRQKERLSLA